MDYPELEIAFHRRDTASYAAHVRFRDPSEEVEQLGQAYPIRFDVDKLRQLQTDPTAYGKLLGGNLLGHPDVRACVDKARTSAQMSERRLRLRLCLDRWSVDLHALRWETLRDPDTSKSLIMDEGLLFSRHLGSFDMRPVQLRSKTQLRALVAVANPADLTEWSPGGRALAPVDVEGELQRARQALEGVTIVELAGDTRVTLDALVGRLREDFDMIYLVCHGALIEGEPRLWLEDDEGGTKVASGTDLIDAFAHLIRLPRLVVLASCQSAGTGDDVHSEDDGVLAALGPRLAEAGIPAVIAMQGNVLQRTVARFMPKFFAELSRDGQIDRAVTEARFAVREQSDYWTPVLFTRLVNGRLWYEGRFTRKENESESEIWEALVDQIDCEDCVPILGSGLLEPLIGSFKDMAHRMAQDERYPLADAAAYDLPKVAQYLDTKHKKRTATRKFLAAIRDELLKRCAGLESVESGGSGGPEKRLLSLLSAAREAYLKEQPAEPHRVLARLNCPVYITTNPDNLLVDALRAEGKHPHEESCDWRKALGTSHAGLDQDDYLPSVDEPLVCQLLGHLSDWKSLVLSEDDYLDCIIGLTRLQTRPQPSLWQAKLADSGLLMLGFHIDQWDFRVVNHFLQSLEGRKLGEELYKNVAVQVEPEEGMRANLDEVRRYLEKYFAGSRTETYWGSVEDFARELNQRWRT